MEIWNELDVSQPTRSSTKKSVHLNFYDVNTPGFSLRDEAWPVARLAGFLSR